MQYRALGRTNLKVSEIGYGCWGLGQDEWQGGDRDDIRKSLRLAFDRGVNFYDTALAYGNGTSETLIADLAKDVGRDNLIIATKIPPKNSMWPAACGAPFREVFPKDHIRACAEKSLAYLKTDAIDLLQLHVWQDEWLEHTEWQEELRKLKQEGKVKFIGVSVNDHDPTSALLLAQHKIADVLQVIYNIYDPSPADALLDLCKADNVGIIARVPFDEGALTGTITAKTTFPKGDFRNSYFSGDRLLQVEEKAKQLTDLLGTEAKTLPELALRFCLSHQAVSTVIPGMRKPAHVESNTSVSDGRLLSSELLSKLTAYAWSKNFYSSLH